MDKEKAFAILDSAVIPLLTQPMQHTLFQEYAKRENLNLVFYTTEDKLTLKKMGTLSLMLPNFEGKISHLIFMRLGQLVGKNKLGVRYVKDLINKGYKLHFIREQIRIKDLNEFTNNLELLNAFNYGDSITQGFIEDAILSTF